MSDPKERQVRVDALMALYARMKAALEQAGGYGALDDEQRDLFGNAVDALMAAKFEHKGVEEAEPAVSAFLDAMSAESEPLPEEEESPLPESTASILIRASDALDRAGQRELSDELDAIIGALGKERE